jgi:hypothetical protein
MRAGKSMKPLTSPRGTTKNWSSMPASCGSICSLDPGRLVIDEGRRTADGISDRQRHALTRLRYVDGNLALRHGVDALALVKAVLVDKIAIERVASMYGAKEGRQQRYWGWAFRRALDALAALLGYAGRARAAPSTAVDKWTLAAIGLAVRIADSATPGPSVEPHFLGTKYGVSPRANSPRYLGSFTPLTPRSLPQRSSTRAAVSALNF